MRNLFKPLILAMGLAVFAARAEATPTSFPAGSLVLPSTATFQSDCGAVSIYGLVYDVLRANGWLTAHGYNPITIYYSIADDTTMGAGLGKKSVNRCRPSNLHSTVYVNNTAQIAATSADASWTDGCDFTLTGTAPLVQLVNNTNTGSTHDTAITTYNTLNKSIVSPQYPNVSLATASTVSYGGSPFIIKNDAPNGKLLGSDAATFLALVQGTLIANDSQGNAIDFSPFRSPTPSVNGSGVSSCKFGTDNYVNIHRTSVLFTAPTPRAFNNPPPRLALLDTNNGSGSPSPSVSLNGCGDSPQFTLTGTTAGCTAQNPVTFAVGDTIVVSGVKDNKYNGTWVATGVNLTLGVYHNVFTFDMGIANEASSTKGNVQPSFTAEPATKSVSGGILRNYLNNAGLSFNGAQGCPTGGTNVLNNNLCPQGSTAGQIYDAFDFADLANNKLALVDASGNARYQMIWTPHWDTSADSANPPSAAEVQALNYINTFLNGQTGLFAECASITSYEGTYEGGSAKVEGATPIQGNLQLQSCPDDGTGNCVVGGSTTFGFARNASAAPSGSLKNCSDITTTSGSCAYFAYPQDPFSQIADFAFQPTGGETHDWNPNTGSVYRPGVLTLISGVASLTNRAVLTTPGLMRGSGQVVTDWFTRNVKDNTVGKGNVAYLGGHDETGSVGATKLVLETLLQLGSSAPPVIPVTVEVSRNSPIAATLNSVPAIVQGSFESVTPLPAPPVIAAAGDIGVWTFPAVYGHLRATANTGIGTTAQKFGATTAIFDAANHIPTVNVGGCGAGKFQGSCRTIFTTTQTNSTGIVGPSTLAGAYPTMVFFEDGNAGTLGPLLAPGLTTIYTTIVDRVLAGVDDGTGNYIPKLGGVDRSTVAVIEPSTVAGVAAAGRPTMAYFGATDGMLHAVCASATASTPCSTLGTELWAFMPRTQLPFVELNTTRIDGSPHVADIFGNFGGATKSFHTILTFQTGSGSAVTGSTPAVYALDVTDPTAPKLLWEVTAPNTPTTPAVGVGLAMANGIVNIGGTSTNLLFAETNNGGTGGTGVVVSAINVEDGSIKWSWNTIYPAPGFHTAGDVVVPASGIPGGVVAVDKTGQGFTTDVVFGDLYGQMWLLDPATGASRYTSAGPVDRPLFEFTTDYHAFGSMPTIYSNGTKQYAIGVPGTFDDPADTWGALTPVAQTAIGVDLSTPQAAGQLTQASGTTYVPFQISLGALSGTNLQGSAQALVVGGQLFITLDNSDVNKASYGLGAQSGTMITYGFGIGVQSTTTIAGGAGSVANAGAQLFTGAGQSQQQMTAATTTVGPSVDTGMLPKLTRNLWLRTL